MIYSIPSPSALSPREREAGWSDTASALHETSRRSKTMPLLKWLSTRRQKRQAVPAREPVKVVVLRKPKSRRLPSIMEEEEPLPLYSAPQEAIYSGPAKDGIALSSFKRDALGYGEEVTLAQIWLAVC